MKLWKDLTSDLLESLPNPNTGYEQYLDIPEFTILGVKNQPDFGHIRLWFYGNETTIELKSLKYYLLEYRDTVISYERAIDVMYQHLMETYKPERLILEISFRPRGGISSTMKIDSDWKKGKQ